MTGTHWHPDGRPRQPIPPLPPPVKQICHRNIHSAAESVGEEGGERHAVDKCETTCTSWRRPLLDNATTRRRWGRGENKEGESCPADNLQSHRPPSRSTGQASRQPGHRSRQRMADREMWTEVRGSSLIISNASNRSSLTAASAHVSISRIDNRDTRTRTRIRFNNRFFDYRLTCLIVIIVSRKFTVHGLIYKSYKNNGAWESVIFQQ